MDDLERQSECSLQTLMMIFSVARSLTSNIKFVEKQNKQTNTHCQKQLRNRQEIKKKDKSVRRIIR